MVLQSWLLILIGAVNEVTPQLRELGDSLDFIFSGNLRRLGDFDYLSDGTIAAKCQERIVNTAQRVPLLRRFEPLRSHELRLSDPSGASILSISTHPAWSRVSFDVRYPDGSLAASVEQRHTKAKLALVVEGSNGHRMAQTIIEEGPCLSLVDGLGQVFARIRGNMGRDAKVVSAFRNGRVEMTDSIPDDARAATLALVPALHLTYWGPHG